MNHSHNESKVKQAAANGEPPIGIPWETLLIYFINETIIL